MKPLPIPSHFEPIGAERVWQVNYESLANDAPLWAKQHGLVPAAADRTKVCLMVIDNQNTFCIPGHELFVGGRSGRGAVDDTVRLCQFIYRNLGVITKIYPTMDTHTVMQIFQAFFWINDRGEHPKPFSSISFDDVKNGTWKVNPAIVNSVGGSYTYLMRFVRHYTETLSRAGKYALTIWPYHAMLGGIGHALTSSIEEACFFHCIARASQTGFEIKGGNPLTENYSVLRPEVLDAPPQTSAGPNIAIAQKNAEFIGKLLTYDAVVIAGQAKSHCVAWTIDDLLTEITAQDPKLAQKVYLLEDCTSPVVVPGVIDYTDDANAAFKRFAAAGMHIVKSTDPIDTWPGLNL